MKKEDWQKNIIHERSAPESEAPTSRGTKITEAVIVPVRMAKTVIIPVSQLVKAHGLIDKIERELLTLGYSDKKLIEELKDCVTVTY